MAKGLTPLLKDGEKRDKTRNESTSLGRGKGCEIKHFLPMDLHLKGGNFAKKGNGFCSLPKTNGWKK